MAPCWISWVLGVFPPATSTWAAMTVIKIRRPEKIRFPVRLELFIKGYFTLYLVLKSAKKQKKTLFSIALFMAKVYIDCVTTDWSEVRSPAFTADSKLLLARHRPFETVCCLKHILIALSNSAHLKHLILLRSFSTGLVSPQAKKLALCQEEILWLNRKLGKALKQVGFGRTK